MLAASALVLGFVIGFFCGWWFLFAAIMYDESEDDQ